MKKTSIGAEILILWLGFAAIFTVRASAYDLEQYYPVGQGDSWTYLVNQEGGSHEETYTVEGEERVGEVDAIKIHYSLFENAYEFIIFDSDGLKLNKESYSGTSTTFEPPRLRFPRLENVGDSKSYSTNSATYGPEGDKLEEVTENGKITLESLENVNTPAGKFENCLKFSSVFSWEGADESKGNQDCTIWLALELGMVKSFCIDTKFNPEAQREETTLVTHELKSAVVGGKNIGIQ